MRSILTDVVETREKRYTSGRRMTPAERRRQLVQGYRASGQTMAAFARRERINYATFAGRVAEGVALVRVLRAWGARAPRGNPEVFSRAARGYA
jgi:hypothetical protein